MQLSQNLKLLWKHRNAVLLWLKGTDAWPNGSLANQKEWWTISFAKLKSNKRRTSWLEAIVVDVWFRYFPNNQEVSMCVAEYFERVRVIKTWFSIVMLIKHTIYWRRTNNPMFRASVFLYLIWRRDFLLLLKGTPINH